MELESASVAMAINTTLPTAAFSETLVVKFSLTNCGALSLKSKMLSRTSVLFIKLGLPPSMAVTLMTYCSTISKSRVPVRLRTPVVGLISNSIGAFSSLYSTIVPARPRSESTALTCPRTVPTGASSDIWNWNGAPGKLGITSFTSVICTVTMAVADIPGRLLANTVNVYWFTLSLSNSPATVTSPLCGSTEKGTSGRGAIV